MNPVTARSDPCPMPKGIGEKLVDYTEEIAGQLGRAITIQTSTDSMAKDLT
jgi:hypothetical protein